MIAFAGPNGFRYEVTEQGMYSDGVPFIKTDINKIVVNADTMILRARSMLEFVNGMFLADAIRRSGGFIRRLIIPYLPGARQDRINPTGDVLFTARSVADMINHRGFVKVVTVDPHSEVMANMIKNLRVYPLELLAEKVWLGYTGVIAPDRGAVERASTVAKAMSAMAGRELPVYLGSKKRDVDTGRLSGFSIDVPKGGHYLVVDDICDGGGTFIGLAEKIKECGAYADLFVTHGIFSKGYTDLNKAYTNIYTTDSIFDDTGYNVYTIPVVKDMERI